ncbi:MAG: hypothetical protein IPH37_05145 [Burkholderiales bacterium]|nr:hypothetical protein [Burkholderiales bacterium]
MALHFSLLAVAVAGVIGVMVCGCEATPKTVPSTASGKKIDVIDLDNDSLIRIYHAQLGAPAMYRDTVLTTLAATRSSEFSQPANAALKESDTTFREQSKDLVFRDFSRSASKMSVGSVLAIPVAFSVMPINSGGNTFQICIEGICAKPYVVKLGQGAYKLHLTVTAEKFLTLTATNKDDATDLESEFDSMGRQGNAVVYAKVDRISLEARYAPTVHASVYRVSLKKRPQYSETTVMAIYRYPELADIKVANSP